MESHEVLRRAFKKVGCKNVAAELGLSLSLIHQWSRGRNGKSEAPNPLDRVEDLMRLTGDGRLVQWMCQRSDGCFVRNAKPGRLPAQLMAAENAMVLEFGDVLVVLARAVQDGGITARGATHIRSRWEELKPGMESFVRNCEHGNFQRRVAA